MRKSKILGWLEDAVEDRLMPQGTVAGMLGGI